MHAILRLIATFIADRLRVVSPKESARENSATRAAARPARTVGTRNCNPLQVRTALLPSTDGASRRPKTSRPAASAESGSSSAKPGQPGKSTGAAGRSTSVAATLFARYRGRWSHIRPSGPGWIASPICADLICDRHRQVGVIYRDERQLGGRRGECCGEHLRQSSRRPRLQVPPLRGTHTIWGKRARGPIRYNSN